MPHRTVDIDGLQIEVFNTALGARHWLKRNKMDCIVVARGSFYFQRKDGREMTVRLNATGDSETRHIFAAANTVADLVEDRLQDKAA